MTPFDLKFPNTQDLSQLTVVLDEMLARHLAEIARLVNVTAASTWQSLIIPLNSMEYELEQFWSPISHLHSVMSSPELRACYELCLPKLSAYSSAIGQNVALYAALKSIDCTSLNSVQKKILEDHLLDFKLSGVELPKTDQMRLEEISAKLSELSNQFENNLLDATDAYELHITDAEKLSGLPAHTVEHARNSAEKSGRSGWVFNLEFPCYLAVMTYADDRWLRATMHYAYSTRASEVGPDVGKFDNSQVMDQILALRHENALLLGFPNYAALSLATKMADSTEHVNDFLNDLSHRAHAQADQEFAELKTYARTHKILEEIEPWDLAYVSEKQKQDCYSYDEEKLRAYFPLPQVMQGLFIILGKLYGMHAEAVPGVKTWHPDVCCYRIMDEKNNTRGYVYLDLFSRENKRGGAWMDDFQRRFRSDTGVIIDPIATITCNFTNPIPGRPATLSHDEVLTLFHEFGHALHHVLTQVEEWSASGIHGVEWDAVELPSQFFENWCWDQQALVYLTANVETGDTLPDDLFKSLWAAKNFQSAMSLMRHLTFAQFDFKLHQSDPRLHKDFLAETLQSVLAETAVVPFAPYHRFPHGFSHIFAGGYAAGYYSYLWADVLASDAFSRFQAEGIFNQRAGQDFLHEILEVGGSCKALQAYINFRKRAPTIDALLLQYGIQ